MKKEEIIFIKDTIKSIRNEYKTIDKNTLELLEDYKNLEQYILMNYKCNNIYDNFKKQICISFKNVKTNDFYNKFLDYSCINPKRKTTCPLSYLIYKLAELKDYEIFIACNLLKSKSEQSRQKQNFLFSNVLYVDIDKVRGAENLDINANDYNNQLVELLYKNYEVSKVIKPTQIIASGSGLHLYFQIETIYFNNEMRYKFHDILYRLTNLYQGDFNCVDIARILRPPTTYNRKEKFSIAKKVEVKENNLISYELREIEKILDEFEIKNGINSEENVIIPEGFILCQCSETLPFSGDIEDNLEDLVIEIEEDFIEYSTEKVDDWRIKLNKEIINNVDDKNGIINLTKNKKQKKDTFFYLSDYEINGNFPNHYLIQDLLFYIKNRNGYCIGARRNLIFCFYFCFRQYCLMGEKETMKFLMLINSIFQEPLKENELADYFLYLSNYELYRGIKNIKVSNLLHFKEEEIEKMRGTYTDNQEEKQNKKLDRNRKYYKEHYQKKKPDRNTIILCIMNNPTKTNIELSKILNVSTKTIQRMKKDLYR